MFWGLSTISKNYLTFHSLRQCAVRSFNIYVPPASVHCMDLNAYEGNTVHLKPLCPGQQMTFNSHPHRRVKVAEPFYQMLMRVRRLHACSPLSREEVKNMWSYSVYQLHTHAHGVVPNYVQEYFGTALLVGGSRDRSPVVSMESFFVATDGTMCPGFDSASKNEYQDTPVLCK